MKTIEEVAFDRYKSDQSLPTHKRMNPSNYIDWAQLGANEAQRWIPVEEEKPDETGWLNAPYLAKTKSQVHVCGYTEGRFHYNGGLCIKENYVTHWRPIERK